MAEKPRDDLSTADALPQTGGGRKKIMLFAGGLVVLIALSVSLTVMLSSRTLPETVPEQNQAPANTGLETELEALQIQVASQAEAIARLEAEIDRNHSLLNTP